MTRTGLGLAVLLAFFGLSAGCGGQQAADYYRDEQIRNDEERVLDYRLTYNQGSNYFIFNEGTFTARITVFPDRAYHFQIELTNATDKPMVIFWKRAGYVDLLENLHGIIHEGVHYLDPVDSQKPTVIQAGASYHDLIRPADRKMLDGVERLVKIKDPSQGTSYGEYVMLILPMKVEGEYRSYRLRMPLGALIDEWPDEDPFWY
jgi:hypothetical protein